LVANNFPDKVKNNDRTDKGINVNVMACEEKGNKGEKKRKTKNL